jgi:cell division protein FtsI/penicillin-binding protein 2
MDKPPGKYAAVSDSPEGAAMKNLTHSWRFSFLGIILSVVPILILGRIIMVQASPAQTKQLIAFGELYAWEPHNIIPARGQIFDRWGNILAGNKTVYEVGITLAEVRNPDTIALMCSVVFGLDYDKVKATAELEASPDRVYRVLTQTATQEQIDQFEVMRERVLQDSPTDKDENPPSLRGLSYTKRLTRVYPEKEVGANILGFVNGDGIGYFGVEEYFNSLLADKPKTIWLPKDPHLLENVPEIPTGADLILTLDRQIQAKMEQIIDDAVDDNGAESGSIVVLDPNTGEIISLATTTRFDPNEYWRYDQVFPAGTQYNPTISQAFEPGSTYKIFTMAAGLDSGAVKPETPFLDTGAFEIGGTVIYNWNYGAWGPQDMQGCMQHSLNVCLAWIATEIGAGDFYKYMDIFGIGQLTGVDMAGEVSGRLKEPGDHDWYDADLGTNSFGQGVAVTPLQMASAASAFANDGVMMAPHVVRSMIHNGNQQDFELRPLGTPVKAETAHTLTEMLARSLETESSDALITGYRVAGKTGTAEIPTPYGYTSNLTNASFIGWGPVDDPQFLVFIWLEKPQSSIWGSVVAAPVFKEVVEELVVLLDIPPDFVRLKLYGQ